MKQATQTNEAVCKSIGQYKNIIFNDIHSSFRVWVDEETFYPTEIIKWHEEILHFFAPITQGEFVTFNQGAILTVQFPASSGMYTTQVQIIKEYRIEGNIYYDAQIISPILRKQLRSYFRLSTLLDLKFTLLSEDTLPGDIHNLEVIPAISVNISAGGLCMLSETKLTPCQKIYIYLEFLGHQIEIIGEVIMNGEVNEFGKYTQRIQFIDIHPKTQDLIAKLIFEKQRLERSSISK